jgi:hypothetical protein
MSRTAPIGLRISSGTYHSPFVGSSNYFFEKQNKQNLALKKALAPLNKTLKWLSGPNKKGGLVVLQPGLMPIHAVLRLKKCLHLAYGQSHTWYTDKILAYIPVSSRFNTPNFVNLNNNLAYDMVKTFKKLCIHRRQSSRRVLTQKNKTAFNPIALGRNADIKPTSGFEKTKFKTQVFSCNGSKLNSRGVAQQLYSLKQAWFDFGALSSKNTSFEAFDSKSPFSYNVGPLMILKTKIQDQMAAKGTQPEKLIYTKVRTCAALLWLGLNFFFYNKPTPATVSKAALPALSTPYGGRPAKTPDHAYHIQNLDEALKNQNIDFDGLKHYPKSSVVTAESSRKSLRSGNQNLWHKQLSFDNVRTHVVSHVAPKIAVSRSAHERCNINLFGFLVGAFAPGLKQTCLNNGPQPWAKKKDIGPKIALSLAVWKQQNSAPARTKPGLGRLKTCMVLELGLHMKNRKALTPALSLRL